MITFFKNPWVWLLFFFVVLSVGTGVFLFGGKSVTVMEKELENVGKEIKQEKLSEEISDELVKKLEEGSGVPKEGEEQNDQSPIINDQSGAEKDVQEIKEEELETENRTLKIQNTAAVVNRLVSWGFAKASERKIDTVVIHSTFNALGGDPFSVEEIISIYKSYGVAPHYLVARDGAVYELVEEKNIAYHAGESKMPDGRTNVNGFSIGIEIIGKDDGSPSDEQYASLTKLLADIKNRNDIKYIVGHSDIASGRKTDPWGFDWKKIGGKDL